MPSHNCKIETIYLKNGVKLLINSIPTAHSISMGLYSLTGLVSEPVELNGIAHFLEHMSFKGTPKYTAKQIAEKLDMMGGEINAHTAKEYTCYYMTVLPHWYEKGFSMLAEIFLNSTIAPADVAQEKKVVLEEINMYNDTPDENIHDLFVNTIWPEHILGLPILGTKKTLANIGAKELRDFKKLNYLNPRKVIISIAGKIPNRNKLVNTISSLFGGLPEISSAAGLNVNPIAHNRVNLYYKKTEQIHLCIGLQGISYDSPDHYLLALLSMILGGTMSSRLFQEVREKKGLAYAIYSYTSFHKYTGLCTIYAGINKDKFGQALQTIFMELTKIRQKKILAKELKKAKENLKGNILIELEKASTWMSLQARTTIFAEKLPDIADILARIDVITLSQINDYAANYFGKENLAMTAMGPFDKATLALSGKITVADFLAINKVKY